MVRRDLGGSGQERQDFMVGRDSLSRSQCPRGAEAKQQPARAEEAAMGRGALQLGLPAAAPAIPQEAARAGGATHRRCELERLLRAVSLPLKMKGQSHHWRHQPAHISRHSCEHFDASLHGS